MLRYSLCCVNVERSAGYSIETIIITYVDCVMVPAQGLTFGSIWKTKNQMEVVK